MAFRTAKEQNMLFSKRDLSKIIIPLLIEQTLAITIGMIDSVMVSSAGESAVSGVSLVDTINLLLIYLFSALAGGGAVIISQLLGGKNYQKANEASKQLVWVVLAVSTIITAFTLLFRKGLLNLIFGKVPPDVMANAEIYFLFTAMSYPFLGLYNAGASIYRAMGNTKTSMYSSLIMNGVNIVGNAVLIYMFHLGAAGAAIATLFSRIVGATIMLILISSKKQIIRVEKLLKYKPDFTLIKQICVIGIPNGLENGMFQFGKVITQSIISGFGTIQIAANAVANSLTALQYIPGNATGLTMITVVGRCVGAGEKEQARKYTKKLVGLTYLFILVISLILCVFGKGFVGLYNLSGQSSSIARNIIFLNSMAVCTIWPLSFTTPNAFRAASDVKMPMILAVVSMWLFRVGFSFVFGVVLNIGVMGIWFAMYLDWAFRASIFTIRFFKNTWLTKYKRSMY